MQSVGWIVFNKWGEAQMTAGSTPYTKIAKLYPSKLTAIRVANRFNNEKHPNGPFEVREAFVNVG